MARSREERYSRSITPQPEEEEEDFVQETLEVALIAAQAYLLTTRPEPRDPREDMHQATIRNLGDEGMTNGPSTFAYLAFQPRWDTIEGITKPMKTTAWRGPGTYLGV
jgi:hypothetical protein